MVQKMLIIIFLSLTFGCMPRERSDVKSVSDIMDSVVSRLYKNVPSTRLNEIDDPFVLGFLTPEEKASLASRYQYFKVNVPVTVSLMLDKDQKVVPFWLAPAGFVKTEMVVRNDVSTYEVWQKDFEAGWVSLGVNGFDKHRPVYFVALAPRRSSDVLEVSDYFPTDFHPDTLHVGSFIYHDWSDLLLTEVPPSLEGQIFFTTVRGRAREAHVVDAFRKTPFPSHDVPDQIVLTWSGDPHTTFDIQWRTNTSETDGVVQYWLAGTMDTTLVAAERNTIQDRMLFNDRYVYRYTAHIVKLSAGRTYCYRAGSRRNGTWSEPSTFTTEPEGKMPFSFVWFGDTHCFPDSGRLVTLAEQKNNEAAFYSIAGDLVSTGLYRDDWDKFFEYAHSAFSRRPLMPVPGNHDRQDGLGARLYYDLFSLPQNGPEKVEKESSYFFEYGDALFVMIDATFEVDDHTAWLERVLANSPATWKFVMFHFPPYNFEEPYEDIQKAWVPLFDKYHVDMVMGGHIHYYMRSYPMHDGKVVKDYHEGTVYVSSISIPNKHPDVVPEPYAAAQFDEGYFYQRVQLDGHSLHYSAVDIHGQVRDEFTIHKKIDK